MDVIRAHPFLTALAAAVALTLTGGFVVYQKSGVQPLAAPSAWGGSGALFAPDVLPNDAAAQADSLSAAQDVPLTHYAPPRTSEEASEFDVSSLIAALSSPEPVETDVDAGISYSFIPQGLITIPSAAPRSATEEALYRFGNELGEYIQTFEASHRGSATILKNHAEDRYNASKRAAVASLGADMQSLGRSIARMDEVPQLFEHAHADLAGSYEEAGQKLIAVSSTESDQAFVAAVNAYNASVEAMVKHFVAVSTLLSVNNVRFEPTDPGSVFMFSGQ